MRAQVGIILISLSLGGCFYMPVVSKGKVSTLDEAPRLAATVSSTAGKAIAAYDPAAKVATTIPAPSGALAGSSVTLPAGALAIAAELVVEEAVPLSQTSVASSLAIREDITVKPVGSGLIIRPTENVDLTKPLTIAMPINPTAGLALNGKYYTVFYKYFVNGELKAGAIRTADLRFSETGSVLFEGYFGAYWLAEVSAPIAEKLEVATAEPIVNKDNVAVVTNTGVVTETEVVLKASIPTVQWLNVSLALDAAQRTVKASASIGSGRTLSACQVDLFEKTDATGGINIDAGSSLTALYKIAKTEAHSLVARFRCMDDQARQTMSPWSSAVSIPGVTATPVVTQPTSNFCGTGAPELRLTTTTYTAAGAYATKAFTAAGNCVYTVDMDAIWGGSFGIATADGSTRCFTNQAPFVGDQTVSCMASTDTSPNMWLPQGNYTIKLDFSASGSNPKMSISLQSCNIGDLYLLATSDYYNWPSPASTNRMAHLGGCQYSVEASKVTDGTQFVRIQNLNGSYSCGDGSALSPHYQKTISCGSTPGYYTMSAYGSFVVGHKYLLNLGNNLDMSGQPTTTPYLWAQEVDKCQENRYLLGPTSAGDSRQPGVNSFMKNTGSCMFEHSFIQTGTIFAPFFIGVGEGTDKCGVAPATTPSTYVALDCSTSAVAIDIQAFLSSNTAYRIEMQSDIYTGRPSSLNVVPINNVCIDPLYAVKNASTGFRPSLQESLTEISECIYQYEWTPTAASRSLSFIQGNNPSARCAKFPGQVDPVVGGPAVEASCNWNYNSSVDYPFTPIGIVDGQRYKINLDFRLGNQRPRINIASHGMMACPDFHVIGLGGLNAPDSSNLMTRNGDCTYSFKIKTGQYAPSPYFHIVDSGGSIQCGRDPNTGSLDPTTGGTTVGMSCSPTAPNAFYLSLAGDSHYQINMQYEAGGNSRISAYYVMHDCPALSLEGPSAPYQNASYSRLSQSVEQCMDEIVWSPTSTINGFNLRWDNYGYSSICALNSGSPQPSLGGMSGEALCGIFNVTGSVNFSVQEGISAGSLYLVRIDRSLSPYDAPKVSVNPVMNSYPMPQVKWIGGSSAADALNTTAAPGARWGAAVWAPPGSQYRYMFGGLGMNTVSGPATELADLWRFDTMNNTWTLLPDGILSPAIGVVNSTGTFDTYNRPSARVLATAIYDPSGAGKLWLYGGSGFSYSGATGYLNDLWVYDLGTNTWAVMSGDPVNPDSSGVMSSLGEASHTNVPGSRNAASGWISSSGLIYIFGGYGYPEAGSPQAGSVGTLNDLWVFDPSSGYATNTWARIGGTNLVNAAGTANLPSTRHRATSWQDDTGRVWLFGGQGVGQNPPNGIAMGRLADMWSYDIGTNTWTRFGGPDVINAPWSGGTRYMSSSRIWPSARFGAAGWKSTDGKLWFVGGDGNTALRGNEGYLNDVWNFDPVTGQWTWLNGSTQMMASYPIPVALQPGAYGTFNVFSIYNSPGSRGMAAAWPDANGNVYIFGGVSNYGYFNDLWYLDF